MYLLYASKYDMDRTVQLFSIILLSCLRLVTFKLSMLCVDHAAGYPKIKMHKTNVRNYRAMMHRSRVSVYQRLTSDVVSIGYFITSCHKYTTYIMHMQFNDVFDGHLSVFFYLDGI